MMHAWNWWSQWQVRPWQRTDTMLFVWRSPHWRRASHKYGSHFLYVYLQLSSFIYHQLVCCYKVADVGMFCGKRICSWLHMYLQLQITIMRCFVFHLYWDFACGIWVGLKQYTTVMWQISKSQVSKFLQIVSNGCNYTPICTHSDVWSCETNAEEVTIWYCTCYVQLSVNSFLYPFSGYSFWRFSDENLEACGCCNEAWILLSCYQQQKLFQAYFKLSEEEWAEG